MLRLSIPILTGCCQHCGTRRGYTPGEFCVFADREIANPVVWGRAAPGCMSEQQIRMICDQLGLRCRCGLFGSACGNLLIASLLFL
ncbi:hypothetical protein, partial [Oceanispirochaeta sp.]|uniref:hypothetical protein n=1 Tax=Oceanispirochaeta sp. TaxID=2035350 RepID=UPI00260A24FD